MNTVVGRRPFRRPAIRRIIRLVVLVVQSHRCVTGQYIQYFCDITITYSLN
jgi:hypothetical protein